MQKTKILAVAPYEGMANIITNLAQKRDDVSLTVRTGDFYTGQEIAMQLAHKNYDVILSRGGTAELIRSSVEIPVIDISISVYDILRSIKLAESYAGKFVIAGFPGITNCAHLLCDLLQYNIDIFTFSNKEDALPYLRKAKDQGCTFVLCDMTGANAAKELGMNPLLISSGVESIERAIDEAVKLVRSSKYVHKQKDLFQAILTDNDQEVLIYSPAGTLWFSSIAIDEMNTSLMNLVQVHLKSFLKVPNQTFVKQIRNDLYTLSNRHLLYENQKYTAISIHRQEAFTRENDPSIVISNHTSITTDDFVPFYRTNQGSDLSRIIEHYSKSRLPVLIIGESGTGKSKVANLLYKNSHYVNSPLVTIDCSLMGERKWNSLIKNENSPLNSVNCTVHLKNPAALSKQQLDQLFNYIDCTNLCKRMRLIVSLVDDEAYAKGIKTVRYFCENHLSCLTLKLPPLRERIDEFSNIIALYIHRLNTALGKQIIGLDTEAMEMMTSYFWPQNLDQLQHVLKELILITDTPYISRRDVKQILSQEPKPKVAISDDFLLNGTLDEINYKIIQRVLLEENNNKEKTSARLGISRSTLWRILKNQK